MIKVRSWLSICSSSSTTISTTDTIPHRETTTITTTPSSNSSAAASSSSSSDQDSYSTSLESNLSLLTHPSLPSLHYLHHPSSPNDNSTTTHLSAVASSSISLTPSPRRRHHHHPSSSSQVIINFLAVHDNYLYAVSGQEIVVYDLTDQDHNNPFDIFGVQDSSSVKSLAFCDGKIFSGHQDSKIRVWKLMMKMKKHKLVATLPSLEDRLRNFILPKNYVRVRRHRKKLWIQHYDAVSGLAVARQNEYSGGSAIYSVSWDKYLKVWKGPDFRCVESVKAHDDAINAVVVSSDGLIYTGSADKRIKVWGRRPIGDKKKKHVLIATLEKHKSAVNALALSSDGTVLFSGSCDRSILVWEREESANHMVLAGALRGHSKAVLCLITVACGGDGDDRDLLFSGSADGTVRVWQRSRMVMDGSRYCCLTVLDGHNSPVKSLVAVPPSRGGDITVVSGSFDGEIKFWEIKVSSTIKKKP